MIDVRDWSSEDLANQHRAIAKYMTEIDKSVEPMLTNKAIDVDYFTNHLYKIQEEIIKVLGVRKINEELKKTKEKGQSGLETKS